MIKTICLLTWSLIALPALLPGNVIYADFETTKGDFTVSLDYANSPLAVANFIQLAGKEDDILESALGVQDVDAFGHDRQLYRPTAESDVQRLPLRVARVPETADFRAYYGIYQSDTLIGGVELFPSGDYHRDITGEDRIRLEALRFDPTQYRITLRYPRPWLDARDLRIKEAPMYRAMKIRRIEQGRRFFAGTMTGNRTENPGYHFQDEVARNAGNLDNPYGIPFNRSGVLAMDTLAPNRNGSGFFITSVADPSLNGRCTAFGNVIDPSGLAVVQGIVNTPLTSEGEPSEEIFLLGITFRRFGLTANAFMEGFEQKSLPGLITPLDFSLERDEGRFLLVSELQPMTQNVIYGGADLRNFSGGAMESQGPNATEGSRSDLTQFLSFFPQYFFKGFATELPKWPSAHLNLENARLFLRANSGIDLGTLNLQFGEVMSPPEGEEDDGLVRAGGTYDIDMLIEQVSPGEDPVMVRSFGSGRFVAAYDSSRGPYEGRLTFSNVTGPLNADQVTLHFDTSHFANNPQVASSLLVRRFSAVTTDPEIPRLNYSGVYRKLK